MVQRQLHLLSALRLPTSYPLQLEAEEVAAWLNGYIMMWHPAALWNASQPPQPSNSYDHDTPSAGFIYVLPKGPQLFQPEDWQQRVEMAPAYALEATSDRSETLSRLLSVARQAGSPPALLEAPAEAVRLFFGLGYGYLLLDTLYEASDHVRLLDGTAFWQDVTAAVQSLQEGGDPRPSLRAAAEKLQQAREQIHPQRLVWVECIQLDPQQLRADWPKAFQARLPVCVLAAGSTLERLAEEEPERFAPLRAAFPDQLPSHVDICCGAYQEREDSFLPLESQLWNLRLAQETVRRLLGTWSVVYARQRSAYHPLLPGWLQHMGYRHAILWPQPGATLPRVYSTAVHWPAPDGTAVDAFCREPLPVHDPLTFFNLVYHMYQAYTNDAAPTLTLLHHAFPPAPYYEDLLALSELAPVFGESVPLHRYFTDVVAGDYIGPQAADEFFVDDLDDRVTQQKRPDPISGFAHFWRWRRRLDAVFTLAGLHRSVTPRPALDDDKLLADLEDLERTMETAGPQRRVLMDETMHAHWVRLQEAWAKKLADRLQAKSLSQTPGYLLFNPCNYTRRVALELSDVPAPIPVADPVIAAEYENGRARLVVEVPPFGYAWFPRGVSGTPPPKPRLTLAEGLTVRNEFFECDIDSTTGGIRSFRDLRRRHTRFGQQLVFNPGSRMIARDISVTHCGAALGEITSVGELRNEHDEVLAVFRQRFRAWLGRPVLEIRISWEDIRHLPSGYPWHAYYAARFGWRDERAVLFRGIHGRNEPTSATRPWSGDYLEVRLGSERSFLYTGGLPFLQRHHQRMVDVLLVTEGEEERTFELLLSTDRDFPMPTAQGWISPAPLIQTDRGPPPTGPSGWLVHIDMPNLLVTSLRPASASAGADRAIALRCLETSGFAGTAECRFARDPSRASRIDGLGQPLQPLIVSGDAVHVDYSGDELFRILVEWD
ncbi:MAG: hypothetical protein KatS3mg106_725 [Gemmataceae bacterium]|nr:MAG: hypothetical protein KatS3mg106_725 [Gemmataceae bacterium]